MRADRKKTKTGQLTLYHTVLDGGTGFLKAGYAGTVFDS